MVVFRIDKMPQGLHLYRQGPATHKCLLICHDSLDVGQISLVHIIDTRPILAALIRTLLIDGKRINHTEIVEQDFPQ